MSQNPYAPGNTPGAPSRPSGPSGYEAWDQPPAQQSMSILALLSLIFSLLCITAPLGVICGISSLVLISSSRGRKYGKGLAVAGLVIGLIISSLMVMIAVGAAQVTKMFNSQGIKPTEAMLRSIDTNQNAEAHTLLTTTAGALVADKQFADFRAAYTAELGAFKDIPANNMVTLFSAYGQIAPALQGLQPEMNKRQNSGNKQVLIPFPGEFEKGFAAIAIEIDVHASNSANGLIVPGSVTNLGIFTSSGKSFWLINATPPAVPAAPAAAPSGNLPPAAPPPPAAPASGSAPK